MSDTQVVTYQLQYRVTGAPVWINWGVPITGDSEVVTGLIPHTSYDFQVLASDELGTAISPTVTVITPNQPGQAQSSFVEVPGVGTFSVTTIQYAVGRARLPGVGTAVGTATVQAVPTSFAILHGIGAVHALGNLAPWSVNLTGAGAVVAVTVVKSLNNAVVIQAVGSVAAQSTRLVSASISIAGTAGVAVGVTPISEAATVSIGGAGAVIPAARGLIRTSVPIHGLASITAVPSVVLTQQWSTTHILNNVPGTGATINLSNGNLTATQAVADDDGPVYSAVTATAGKFYWEIFIHCADVNQITIGIGNINAGWFTSQWVGSDANALGWLGSNGGVVSNGNNGGTNIAFWDTWPTDTTLGLAVDLDNNLFWGRVGSAFWNASSTANPALGTSGGGLAIPASVLTASVGPGCTFSAVGDFCIGQFAPTSWLNSAPASFVPWANVYNPSAPASITQGAVTATTVTFTWTASP